MQLIQSDHTGDRRLRFVFSDRVLSFLLASDATFGDVAWKLGEVFNRHCGNPVGIDVTLGSGEDHSAHGISSRSGLESAL